MSVLPRSYHLLPFLALGLVFSQAAAAAPQHFEKHFPVKGRPVVIIRNIANGRIEVKSWKNPEVVLTGTQASDKVDVEAEQAGERIDVSARTQDKAAQPADLNTDFELTVPEETELQLKSQAGLIYVEQVMGDMTLQSVAGDIHLKEVSGYVVVRTTGGSLVCTQCAGKLDFTSVSGNAQILQPGLTHVRLFTMSGNILYDGDFIRSGIYTMRSAKGIVEVRFSGSDSFDIEAMTAIGTVDNQAAAYLKPDAHGIRNGASRFAKGFFGSVGSGFAKVELSSYSGTIRILRRD